MAEPVLHQGAWWFQRPDGVWLRWNDARGEWEPPPPQAPVAAPMLAGGASPESPRAAVVPQAVPAYRALRAPATVVYVMAAIVLVCTVAAIVSGFFEVSLLGRIADGENVTQSEAENNDLRVAVITALRGLAYLGTAIAFIVWFYRAHVNLRALGASEVRHASGWAIGAWFIPFFNLVRPKSMANDVWKASDPELPAPVGIERWSRVALPTVLAVWWAAWVLASLVSSVAAVLALGDDPETLKASSEVALVSDGLSLLGGILLIGVVRSITARQQARHTALADGAQPA